MMKIVLVDDEDLIRQGLEKILSKSGLDVEVTGSFCNGMAALTGLDKLEGGAPDVVITDIRMPQMDGLTFIEKLRAKLPEAVIIVLSGFNEFEYARHAMRFGVHDYFLKPVDKSELFETLRTIAARRREASAGAGLEGTADITGGAAAGSAGGSEANAAADKGAPSPERSGHYVMEAVKRILDKEYDRNLELDDLAERIGYSSSYIGKQFKLATGMTITDYLMELRIAKAKQFIDDHPQLRMYEIAEIVGYPDPVYFNKLFKKRVGVTPKEYRARRPHSS
jgi:YesN/AraC family two-component response regulator